MSELRNIRKQRGLTLEAVAFLGDCDPATISRWENEVGTPRPETIVAVARGLGVQISRITPKEKATA